MSNITNFPGQTNNGFMAQLHQGIVIGKNRSYRPYPSEEHLLAPAERRDFDKAVADLQEQTRHLGTEMQYGAVTQAPVSQKAGEPRYTVVYNPASLDSVYAASQLVCSQLGEIECVAHSFLDSFDALLGKDHLLVCGTELNQSAMTALLKQGTGRVTLFAYAASYSWLELEADSVRHLSHQRSWRFSPRRHLTDWGDRLEIVRQHNNSIEKDYTEDPLFLKMDNTATTLTWQWLLRRGMTVENTCLREGRVAAQRLSSLAFPVLSDLTRVGETPSGKAWQEQEVRNKAILHHLLGGLRSALGGVNPMAKLRDVKPNASTDSYLEHWRNVGRSVQRAAGDRHYRCGTTVYSVKTMACTEMVHHDILPLAVSQSKSLVTYEDVHGIRIWRIYAKDMSVQLGVLRSLKGAEVWCEGPCLCTYTKVPESR